MKDIRSAGSLFARVSALALVASAGVANAQTACGGVSGADVIVGDLTGPSNYAIDATKQTDAFSIGTTSCNMGLTWLNWISSTNQHPVIGGAMYKMKGGKFEQVGFSWLKHGFYALSQTLCCSPCSSTDGTHLGVRCSDPYTSDRNGTQGSLGPRWQVNPSTGSFTYPPASPSYSGNTARRVQVKLTDLEVTNANVIFVTEAQYVTPDDALAGNKNNNASWRRVTLADAGGTNRFSATYSGATVRQQAAIQAWGNFDATVYLTPLDAPSDGRFWVGCKVTDLGNGTWSYEYAIQNLNSDRAAGSFSIPLADGVTITNIGFHDVPYYDGDGIPTNPANPNSTARNYDGTDWAGVVSNGAITWSCPQTYAQNTNANALRWGTLYNFRFVANVGPQRAPATLGMFKPLAGQADGYNVSIDIPGIPPSNCPACAADFDSNGGIDGMDLALFFADYEAGSECSDVDNNGGIDGADLAYFFSVYEAGGC